MNASSLLFLFPILGASALGCSSSAITAISPDDAGTTGDSSTSHDGGATDGGPQPDASGDGGACAIPTSPSGYACDPWSTHLYASLSVIAMNGGKLRLRVEHNPDNEGNPTDVMPAPGHDYYQQLIVDIDLTPAVRDFLCVVFTSTQGAPPIDASGATFLTDVDIHVLPSLLSDGSDGMAHISNLRAICGTTMLTAVYAPRIAMTKPVLPDVVLVIPLQPAPKNFTAGTQFGTWLARGSLGVDEDRELTPQLRGTVVQAQ